MSPRKTFFPKESQVKNIDKLPPKERELVLEQIAEADIEAFLRCNGVFSDDAWFSYSQKEVELVKKVAARIEKEKYVLLARIVGNKVLADFLEEGNSNSYEKRWKHLVDGEIRNLNG